MQGETEGKDEIAPQTAVVGRAQFHQQDALAVAIRLGLGQRAFPRARARLALGRPTGLIRCCTLRGAAHGPVIIAFRQRGGLCGCRRLGLGLGLGLGRNARHGGACQRRRERQMREAPHQKRTRSFASTPLAMPSSPNSPL